MSATDTRRSRALHTQTNLGATHHPLRRRAGKTLRCQALHGSWERGRKFGVEFGYVYASLSSLSPSSSAQGKAGRSFANDFWEIFRMCGSGSVRLFGKEEGRHARRRGVAFFPSRSEALLALMGKMKESLQNWCSLRMQSGEGLDGKGK